MLFKEKAKKVIAAIATAALAVTAAVPAGFTMPTFAVDDAAGETQTWDFRKGEIVTDKSDGVADITSGNLTIRGVSTGQYKLNGSQHGAQFVNGNTIEIIVSGPTKLTVGGCQFNNQTELTVTSLDGSYEETQNVKGACYDQDPVVGSGVYTYKGEATTLILKCTGTIYIPIIIAEPIVISSDEYNGNYKTDVWDFGAEQFSEDEYNNMLTVDNINKNFYPEGTEAGADGKNLASFKFGDLEFNDGGFSSTHRLRTQNESITRYDEKNGKLGEEVLNGYIYSNKSSTSSVYIGIKLYDGDILTVYAGGNSAPATVTCESPSGELQSLKGNSKDGSELTFYATETGTYKLYTLDEKLVVYRLYRAHARPTEVSGEVDTTEAEGLSEKAYGIKFTNQNSGAVTVAPVENGKYSVSLFGGYTYDVALEDANGYIITSADTLEVANDGEAVINNIVAKSVDLVTITGQLTGLSADAIKALTLKFNSEGTIYVPEMEINEDGTFTLKLETGVNYTVTAEGVNDYELQTTSIMMEESGAKDIVFEAKPVYDVTVDLKGLSDEAKANAQIVFTNINEDGYEYTFKASDAIKLRNGQYAVSVKDTGIDAVIPKPIADVKVNNAASKVEVTFDPVETWDFAKYNGYMDTDKAHFLGLAVTNGKINQNKYLLVGANGEVKVPVKKGQLVTLTYCYSGTFTINGEEYTTVNSENSTSKTDVVTVAAEEDGYLTVSVQAQTYFNSISVVTAEEYKETVTVGVDKDYQTINEALAAVARMSRPNGERVEIVIDPGNYEEMLVVNVPNVSFVNAAGKDSSLEIKDKGVNIGENVVRITSYYGHGYSYYSMGDDCKWNADVLAANKSNDYLSKVNPGTGTTDGSYWNATVVVMADGFEADGIVFENSFNQYISEKEANDIVVKWDTGAPKGGDRPTKAGDTSVQDKKYVERAAALAINSDNSVFVNCKFIGRQDTLYGTKNVKAAFHKCDVLGATDFIFGGMTAVFYKCNLVMNTSEDGNDVAYLTAAQQDSGRGYLMYECTVTSTTPGVDTASAKRSKPGYFGRPWTPNTSEVVFYNTTIETTDFNGEEESLILSAGWLDSLSGQSEKMMEYGTIEKSGVDNSASRASWATFLEEAKIGGEDITIALFLGEDWTNELQARSLLTEEVIDDPDDSSDDSDNSDVESSDDESSDDESSDESSEESSDESSEESSEPETSGDDSGSGSATAPGTGASGIPVMIGIISIAGAAVLVSRKRTRK